MSQSGAALEAADAIAIIGMAGRFPGAATLEQFWANLRDGVESIAFFTDEELLAEGYAAETIRHPTFVKAKGALDGVPLFDAGFFGYTPKEAQLMDPQQRLFLESGWEALERSGYDADRYPGAIAVFAGAAMNQYFYLNVLRHPDAAQAIAYDKDFLSTRLSYKLNLSGPSVVVQTACSTSLAAVCQACQSLLSFQCDMAIAGAVALTMPIKSGYFYQEGSILSPDGHCRAFDANAHGTVMGNGVGAVVLKRLAEAIADGDRIHAVIKGFALNNDGSSKMGYMAPSIEGQAQVIRLAQALAGVSADSIGYVEAHGTGTELGDPIELAALTQAFRAGTRRNGFCAIGSVKTNVGHLDTAAGMAGLIKAVLALEHRQIPPSLHFEQPNPKIEFESSPFFVNTRLADWTGGPEPRRAGVSSFGIGGTNAHIVLEEAPAPAPAAPSREWKVLVLSARTTSAVDKLTANLATALDGVADSDLADVAYTLQVGRKGFAHRRMVVCRDVASARTALQIANGRHTSMVAAERDAAVVFLFPGQGAQRLGMGRELYRTEPAFRMVVDDCAERLRAPAGMDIRDVLLAQADHAPAAAALQRTGVTQAALFVVEYALARLWMSWGVRPAAMIGHSVGEYVAACISGVLGLDDALRLVAVRGALMEAAPAGRMLAVALTEAQAAERLGDGLWLAAVNGPGQCVIGGTVDAVGGLETRLIAAGIANHRLTTAGAFHSGLMTSVVAPLTEAARGIRIGAPTVPYISNVTGTWMTEGDAGDPEYWGRHVRSTVRFGAGLETVLALDRAVCLEVGPGHALSGLVRQRAARLAAIAVSSLNHPGSRASESESLAVALGELWLHGVRCDWKRYYGKERRRRVPLPTYPFERKRHWAEAGPTPVLTRGPSSAENRTPGSSEWLSLPSWRRVPALREASMPRCTRWIVLADPFGLGDALAGKLGSDGSTVTVVHRGDRLEREHNGLYTARAADYGPLFTDLLPTSGPPAGVVHLWSIGGGRASAGQDAQDEQVFFDLLSLAQALGTVGIMSPVHLAVISDGLHDITGHEVLRPGKATLLGPCRVLPQEFANVSCRSVDIVMPESDGIAPLADRVAAELDSRPTPVVALRGIDRWVQAFEPVHGGTAAAPEWTPAAGGTYLITGGLGAMGLEFAALLAQAPDVQLILTSRRGLPARCEWRQMAARMGRDHPIVRRIHAVEALERRGATVVVADVDISDEVGMAAVVAAAFGRSGRIDGVIHAAGVPGDGTIQLKTAAVAAEVMAPKVAGTRALASALAGGDVGFIVLCSSLASIAGGFGQVDYCAANAYMDAFARWSCARNGLPMIAINWDAWSDRGMAVDAMAARRGRDAAARVGALSPAEGVEMLRRVLSLGAVPQVIVSPMRDGEATLAVATEQLAADGAASGRVHEPRPPLANPFVSPSNETEHTVCAVWRDVLGLDAVGIHDSFFDLGGHSLLGIEIVARLNGRFGTSVPVARLYEGLTPAFLAHALRNGDRAFEPGPEDGARRRQKAAKQKQRQETRQVARKSESKLA